MATNTASSYPKEAAKGKTQTFNPATGHYVKRDAKTGQFEAVKRDGKPFKGVEVERTAVKYNPSISKESIAKARKVVADYLSGKAA